MVVHHFDRQGVVEQLPGAIYVAGIATAVHFNQHAGQAARAIGDAGRNLPHEDGCAFVGLESPSRHVPPCLMGLPVAAT
ncbi:hypothetical protein A176_002526 [Myxococcus hansupus]|uniref:Uncharacterized protein n=1 Tax=Pseudomyxococcus hansupus TaxID=1297742 RepID=A0A0H4WS29_9BACT|nr:hypothetical protein A176_002526 [Myxococcus hansupus]